MTVLRHEADLKIYETDKKWADFLQEYTIDLKKIVKECCPYLSANANLTVEIILNMVSDSQIQALNHEYRQKNKITNVLSFPMYTCSELKAYAVTYENFLFLGEIYIAYDYCEKEAKALGINFKDHIFHMLIHGVLHLMGYDHEENQEAEEMMLIEKKILAIFAIHDPYREKNSNF